MAKIIQRKPISSKDEREMLLEQLSNEADLFVKEIQEYFFLLTRIIEMKPFDMKLFSERKIEVEKKGKGDKPYRIEYYEFYDESMRGRFRVDTKRNNQVYRMSLDFIYI